MNESTETMKQEQFQGMCQHGNFRDSCEKCATNLESNVVADGEISLEGSEPTFFEQIRSIFAEELVGKSILTDDELGALVRKKSGSGVDVFYHASTKANWESVDASYFDRDQIVLAGGHFSYKADNLSYGSYDPAKLVEFRVIDLTKELKDTSETGEGTQVGHEAVATRPLILRKIDDRLYSREEIEAQSQLPHNFSTAPDGVIDVKIRQLTYMIDREATDIGTLGELLNDPAFAKKYLEDDALESLSSPLDFIDEDKIDELADVAELEPASYKEPKTRELLGNERIELGGWLKKALKQEEQVVRVLARESKDWREKTYDVLKRVVKHEKFINYYLNEFMPDLVSDGGMYDIDVDELAQIKKTEEDKIARYRE